MSESRNKRLESSMTLPEFLRTVGTLSVAERTLIARQALVLLEQNYAHLPLKLARYAVNPEQRLRLLIARLERGGPVEAEWRFHAELLEAFDSVRDLHTRYVLPAPLATAVAFLPFQVKEFVEDGARHFLALPGSDGSSGTLPARVELISWNGVPMERAVDLYGDTLPGANPAARLARALATFTVRSLGFAGPPDEEFVVIQYLDHDQVLHETREVWQVTLPRQDLPAGTEPVEQGSDVELDVEGARVAWLRTVLFAPHVLDLLDTGQPEIAVTRGIGVTREFATRFEARVVPGLTPEVGHLRIRSFDLQAEPTVTIKAFVDEFLRLLRQMPANGLIVDIRGNGGGSPTAAELCLQALSARPIESEPLQFVNSPLNLSICRRPGPGGEDLTPWRASMEQAVESGAVYSAGVPRTPPELLAKVPQADIGPVVLLTDARVYSAADRFAAGFQDHEVGTVLGVDRSTGAGGANVWRHRHLLEVLAGAADSPYEALPEGCDISVAIRRTLRVHRNAGVPVEDFGVEPREIHQMTRKDVLQQGIDLMAHAARLLRDLGPPRRFVVELQESGEGLAARLEVENVDRADFYTDGKPRQSVDLADGPTSVVVAGAGSPARVRVEGFAAGRPVAVRSLSRDQQNRLVLVESFTP
jgi:hypothetical protein